MTVLNGSAAVTGGVLLASTSASIPWWIVVIALSWPSPSAGGTGEAGNH